MAYLRPNWFTRKVFNPLAMRTGLSGVETLTVHGRRSGKPRSVPVIPVEHCGMRYVLSPRGECDWVKNLRAAGGGRLTRRGHTHDFAAEEIPVDSRPPVLAAYQEKAGRAVKSYFDRLPDPADHPVFLVDAEAGRSQSATAGS
jgi:deazaflavin-dependent oxidoreductase (nitroreductase family)